MTLTMARPTGSVRRSNGYPVMPMRKKSSPAPAPSGGAGYSEAALRWRLSIATDEARSDEDRVMSLWVLSQMGHPNADRELVVLLEQEPYFHLLETVVFPIGESVLHAGLAAQLRSWAHAKKLSRNKTVR